MALEEKQYQNDSDQHDFLIDQTFPRFSPAFFRTKENAGKFDLWKIRADPSRSNIVFPRT